MRTAGVLVLLGIALSCTAQVDDRLTPEEVRAAIAAKPNSGWLYLEDMGFTTPTTCKAQMPSESIYTPAGWVNARAIGAKQQFLKYDPPPDDTRRVLTVISKGCASGQESGPACDSITRAVLLSDKGGSVVVEALDSQSTNATWQNKFGATNTCTNLLSHFAMSDLSKVRNAKGEFVLATFNGGTHLKSYVIKQKHLKDLGL